MPAIFLTISCEHPVPTCVSGWFLLQVEFLRPMTASILSERRAIAPFGLLGGGPGATGVNLLLRNDGRVINLGAKSSVAVSGGDCLRILTPGKCLFLTTPTVYEGCGERQNKLKAKCLQVGVVLAPRTAAREEMGMPMEQLASSQRDLEKKSSPPRILGALCINTECYKSLLEMWITCCRHAQDRHMTLENYPIQLASVNKGQVTNGCCMTGVQSNPQPDTSRCLQVASFSRPWNSEVHLAARAWKDSR